MKRIKTMNYITAVLLFAMLALLIAASYIRFDKMGMFDSELIIVILLGLVFVVVHHFIHIIAHEVGHLIFGLINKFKFCSFSIGCFIISKKGIKIQFKNHYGACVMYPKTSNKFYKRNFLYLLGGAVFSLALFVLGGVFLYVDIGLSKYAYLFLGLGFATDGYLFFRNILPYSAKASESDGAKMLGIIKKSPEMQVNLRLFSIQCLLIGGVMPRDIERDMFFNIPVLADNSQERLLMEDYRFLWYLDCGDISGAIKCCDFMEEFIDDIDDYYYPSILTDIYFVTVRYKKDLEKAEKLYLELGDFLKAEHNITNSRLIMSHELYIEKKYKQAIATGREGISSGKDFIIQGIVPLEERLIEEMLVEAKEQKQQDVVVDTLTPYLKD